MNPFTTPTSQPGSVALGWSDLASLVDDCDHYIESPHPELYDIAADPGEKRDLAEGLPPAFRSLRAELARMPRPLQPPGNSDPEQVKKLAALGSPEARWLDKIADALVKKSVWIVGGDGWAYDIGYGGLDHVIAAGRDVNILVLDTEVYSNTGGQASKATPMAAAAKFAMAGKATHKKDLAMLAVTYGHAYVARVAMGAKDAQTVNAFKEAESFPGTSVIVAYSHCIAHGYEMSDALKQQERAVDSAYWSLFRYDPRKAIAGESPLKLDSGAPKISLAEFMAHENRFKQVQQTNPEGFKRLVEESQRSIRERFALLEQLARAMSPSNLVPGAGAAPKARA